jgi:hypothetical protein
VTHGENSEVLPAASVAVAVMTEPIGARAGRVTLITALHEASVETFVDPMSVRPSPNPDVSQEVLEKNSTRKPVFAVLLSVP